MFSFCSARLHTRRVVVRRTISPARPVRSNRILENLSRLFRFQHHLDVRYRWMAAGKLSNVLSVPLVKVNKCLAPPVWFIRGAFVKPLGQFALMPGGETGIPLGGIPNDLQDGPVRIRFVEFIQCVQRWKEATAWSRHTQIRPHLVISTPVEQRAVGLDVVSDAKSGLLAAHRLTGERMVATGWKLNPMVAGAYVGATKVLPNARRAAGKEG